MSYSNSTGYCFCERCGYGWKIRMPRNSNKYPTDAPKSCARCKSKVWNQPRVYAGKYISGTLAKRFKPTGRAAAKLNYINSKYDYYVVGVSSGKDSTGLLLWLLNEFKINRNKLICTFSDTGNEADEVYQHIDKISRELHPIITLKPELDFFELARSKKRFPDTIRRFCTEQLKLMPLKTYLETLDGRILTISGVRAEESKRRAKYKEFVGMYETFTGYDDWRPLLKWKLEDIFLIHKRYGFPLNPLYDYGFSRVGCNPCIMLKKEEVKLFAELFPEKVNLIREAENTFPNRNNFYQFFPLNKTPERFKSKTVKNSKGENLQLATIDDVILWSRTKSRSNELIIDEPECKAGFCE